MRSYMTFQMACKDKCSSTGATLEYFFAFSMDFFDAFVYHLIDWRDFTVLGLFHIFSVWTVLVSFELIFFSTIRFSCLWTQSWLFQMQLLMTLFSKQRISLRDFQVKSFKRLNLKKGQNIRKSQNIRKGRQGYKLGSFFPRQMISTIFHCFHQGCFSTCLWECPQKR